VEAEGESAWDSGNHHQSSRPGETSGRRREVTKTGKARRGWIGTTRVVTVVWKCGFLGMDEDMATVGSGGVDSGMEFAQERAYKPLNSDCSVLTGD
jgi:hypothetical protein